MLYSDIKKHEQKEERLSQMYLRLQIPLTEQKIGELA